MRHPVSLLILYDTIIQHGYGDDKDGLPELLKCSARIIGGYPHDGIDETQWIRGFLEYRKSVLKHPQNRETHSVWAQSVPRVDALIEIVDSGNFDLSKPLTLNPWGTPHALTP